MELLIGIVIVWAGLTVLGSLIMTVFNLWE